MIGSDRRVYAMTGDGEFDPVNPLFSAIRLAPDSKSNGKLQAEEIFHKPHIPALHVDNARKGFIGAIEHLALREALRR